MIIGWFLAKYIYYYLDNGKLTTNSATTSYISTKPVWYKFNKFNTILTYDKLFELNDILVLLIILFLSHNY